MITEELYDANAQNVVHLLQIPESVQIVTMIRRR